MLKKIVTPLLILLVGLMCSMDIQAQDPVKFDTGEIAIQLAQFGNVRVFAPGAGAEHMIDRFSILVGVSETAVFTYRYDADRVESPANITPATYGDFEITGLIDNYYSEEPPDVEVRTNIYGWNNKGFVLVKYTVENIGNAAINAAIGLEILPEVDDAYGNESVRYLDDDMVVNIYKDSYVGFKILSADLYSLKMFGWTAGYGAVKTTFKSELYGYLSSGTIDNAFDAGADGSVVIMGQDKVMINPGETTVVYFAVALGSDEASMVANIAAAKDEYDTITSIVDDGMGRPFKYALEQNYPNPFNPVTTIRFSIPQQDHVTLTVYNVLGQQIATLLNEEVMPGEHSVQFNAFDLPSGAYFYTIRTDSFHSTKRMLLVK